MLTLFPLALAAAVTGVYGIGSPYLAAAAAIAVGSITHQSPYYLTLTAVVCYVVNSLASAGHEFGGTSTDVVAVLGSDHAGVIPNRLIHHRGLKALALGVAALLPINAPPGYFTGAGALILVLTLTFLVRRRPLRVVLVVLVSGVLYAGAYAYAGTQSSLAVLGLIAGLFVPSLVLPDRTPAPYTTETTEAYPNPVGVVLAAALSWLTPGFSTGSATTALLNPTVYRPAIVAVVSGAIEGWNLQLIERGGQSGKTALGALLTGPLEPVPGMIAITVVLALGFYLVPLGVKHLTHAKWIRVGSLVTQSVVTAGLPATLLFLLVGSVTHAVQLKYAPGEGETRALAFLIPTVA